MTEASAIEVAPAARREHHLGRYPLILPGRRDPRLHLAAVIVTLQVLGQTVLGFELSIAQILVALVTAATIEAAIVFWRRRVLMWPASALLTGNGVAFILRVPGTPHGDWWSLHGGWIFAATAAVSVLSKYVIRWRGRHLFNPSNVGLLVCFLVLGSRRVDPQDLWWGPPSPRIAVTLAVILIGGFVILGRLRLLALAATFWVTFALAVGLVASTGHAITARWHVGTVGGLLFWTVLVTSPEILVFLFFMLTDPKTIPTGRRARTAHAAGVAVIAGVLLAPAGSEFSTKVAILGGLAVVCLLRPVLEWAFPEGRPSPIHLRAPARAVAGAGAAVLAAGLVVLGALHSPHTTRNEGTGSAEVADAPPPGASPAAPVSVDPAVGRAGAGVDPATAQAMARDLMAELATGRPLPGASSKGADGGGPPTYRFNRLTVVLVRDPDDTQAAPGLGLAAEGTEQRAGGAETPCHLTFSMALRSGRYTVTSVTAPAPSSGSGQVTSAPPSGGVIGVAPAG